MGVEPFLAASAVEAVVAQRLVRRLCKDCCTPYDYEETFLHEIGFPTDRIDGRPLCVPNGCEGCRGTGFHGRIGIFELLNVSDPVQSLVIQRASMNDIRHQGLKEGMRTLRDDGWLKVLNSVTTIEEVLRVTEENA